MMRSKLPLRFFALILAFLPTLSQAEPLDEVNLASAVLKSDILQGLAAKEICTCMYLIRVGDGVSPPPTAAERLNLCLQRASLSISGMALHALIAIDVTSKPGEVRVGTQPIGGVLSGFKGGRAIARYEGDSSGCRLLTDEELKSLR